MITLGENWSQEGRVIIEPGDPLYAVLGPRPELIAALERMERERAAGWARVRFMPLGAA